MSWNIRPCSSQLAEPLWTDPGIKSGISVCELISTRKKRKEKKRSRGLNGRTFSGLMASEEKATNKTRSFQICMIITLLGVYLVIGGFMTLTLSEGHRCVRNINCKLRLLDSCP